MTTPSSTPAGKRWRHETQCLLCCTWIVWFTKTESPGKLPRCPKSMCYTNCGRKSSRSEYETAFVKENKVKATSNSGAGDIDKGDFTEGRFRGELKETIRPEYRLTYKVWHKISQEAALNGQTACMAVAMDGLQIGVLPHGAYDTSHLNPRGYVPSNRNADSITLSHYLVSECEKGVVYHASFPSLGGFRRAYDIIIVSIEELKRVIHGQES